MDSGTDDGKWLIALFLGKGSRSEFHPLDYCRKQGTKGERSGRCFNGSGDNGSRSDGVDVPESTGVKIRKRKVALGFGFGFGNQGGSFEGDESLMISTGDNVGDPCCSCLSR